MIHIRANRADPGYVELHINSQGRSVSFPGCEWVTVNDLDDLIATLLKVQRFMEHEPASNFETWEVN